MAKKILIIEDNDTYSSILTKKFETEEFEVISAKDGLTGVSMALDNKPDIILIDLLLPKMNGIQLMEELRKQEWGRGVPLLILTNINPDPQILESINKNKPAYYLLKPEVTLDEVVEKINSLFLHQT